MLVSTSVRDVMQSPVVTAAGTDAVGEVVATMRSSDVGSVVIVEGEAPVGIVTESTVVDCYCDGVDQDRPVEEVMSAPLVTIEADAPIEAAAARMREHDVTKLPIRADGTGLVGILSTSDLADYIPTLAHRAMPKQERSAQRREGRADTAYEHDDWHFESYGEGADTVDVGDVVIFEKDLADEDVAAFAEASGDTNRLHLDDEFAEGTRFGRRIVHGTLVCGLVSAALARLPGLIVYLSQSVTYAGPVDVGATARAECAVVESLGKGRFRLSTTVESDGETVIEGEATVLADPLPEEGTDTGGAESMAEP